MTRPYWDLRLWLVAMATTVLLLAAAVSCAIAGETRVAVAANFTEAAKEIGARFEAASGHVVLFSFASTGTLFTQISQGAPFDVFLAADQARPARAEAEGVAVSGSRFTYATGRIVLYSRDPALVTGPETLGGAGLPHIAIANPATAPYGAAAVETMRRLGVEGVWAPRIVRGASIAQTFQFVQTGNADLGFVALSQVARNTAGSRWVVPEEFHAPIAQDAVLLTHGAGSPAARDFVEFLKGEEARVIKEKYGYGPGN